MAKNQQRVPYDHMVAELRQDPMILGMLLAGSRAKGMETAESDCDIYVIFRDEITLEQIEAYKNRIRNGYSELNLDLSNKAMQRLAEFKMYATIGSEWQWDRYNIVRAKLEFDNTAGIIQQQLHEKTTLTTEETDIIIQRNLGDYITHSYCAVKLGIRHETEAALLHAAESVNYLLWILFALHKRVRPLNDYLRWELEHFPLRGTLATADVLMPRLEAIITKADACVIVAIFEELQKSASLQGYDNYFRVRGNKLPTALKL